MNLLKDPWIPVRADGTGPFRQITYEELLCRASDWHISLPRDDMEMACLQLLACLTQVIFLPESNSRLREYVRTPLRPEAFADGVRPYLEWFDLDHPEWPFMQTHGVKAAEATPIQKLLIGLPEGNNHAFFNAAGEVRHLGPACTAIALFNQASNSPSFGGGFKGSLRGNAPITTLVSGDNLRETVWRNVITRERVLARLPGYDPANDKPTWVAPIKAGETIQTGSIGLLRGLFWQPAHVQLVRADREAPCDCLGGDAGPGYSGFLKEKFNFTVSGVWPHPHGPLSISVKKGQLEQKFASFTTKPSARTQLSESCAEEGRDKHATPPAWTQLSEFVVPRDTAGGQEGQSPAEPVTQFGALYPEAPLHLLVGGYCANQASILERRHEFFSIAKGWAENRGRLERFVEIGLQLRTALRGNLCYAAQGHKDNGWQGLGAPVHKTGEELFFQWTENLVHRVLRNFSSKEFRAERERFAAEMAGVCIDIFEHLTQPYARKPELIPIIAAARRGLERDLNKVKEAEKSHAN
ncbi:MAG: type I-E CRISPR-associated protein Cse1/CasA [Pseudomonadota bacterium]